MTRERDERTGLSLVSELVDKVLHLLAVIGFSYFGFRWLRTLPNWQTLAFTHDDYFGLLVLFGLTAIGYQLFDLAKQLRADRQP
jgi:hypothetical protein